MFNAQQQELFAANYIQEWRSLVVSKAQLTAFFRLVWPASHIQCPLTGLSTGMAVLHIHTAVDIQGGAGDVLSPIRGQEQGRCGDIIGLTKGP